MLPGIVENILTIESYAQLRYVTPRFDFNLMRDIKSKPHGELPVSS